MEKEIRVYTKKINRSAYQHTISCATATLWMKCVAKRVRTAACTRQLRSQTYPTHQLTLRWTHRNVSTKINWIYYTIATAQIALPQQPAVCVCPCVRVCDTCMCTRNVRVIIIHNLLYFKFHLFWCDKSWLLLLLIIYSFNSKSFVTKINVRGFFFFLFSFSLFLFAFQFMISLVNLYRWQTQRMKE